MTLEELAAFYADMFATNPDFPVQLTVQDAAEHGRLSEVTSVRTKIHLGFMDPP